MKLYFRGAPYEYNPSQPEEVLQLVPQSGLVLRYRGVLYIRERRSPYRKRIGAEVTHLPSGGTQ